MGLEFHFQPPDMYGMLPIVRGKAKANVEFGAKVAISLVDGYALMEKLDWDSYNEGVTLKVSVEAYYQRYGYYPEAVLAIPQPRQPALLQGKRETPELPRPWSTSGERAEGTQAT